MPTDSFQPVLSYLRKTSGKPSGLTPDKLRDRGRLIDDPDRSNEIVFEVERHSGALGSVYRPGQPMAAFITYWPVYAFDPENETLKELDERRDPELTIKDWLFVDREMEQFHLHLEERDEGGFHCYEEVTGEKTTVTNIDDIKAFAVEVVRNWDFSYYKKELKPFMEAGAAEERMEELIKQLEEVARRKARESWEFYVEEE